MSQRNLFTDITIETLVFVAVWKLPFVFQGCFKITKSSSLHSALLFFRSEYYTLEQSDIISSEFSPQNYYFSHLYNESQPILLESLDDACKNALYLLKYALHATLKAMCKKQAQRFISIDDVALRSMIKRIEPILHQKKKWMNMDDDLGFATIMNFNPTEEIGESAVSALLTRFLDLKADQH